MPRPYTLSCHYGTIRLTVDADLTVLQECNCSTCARTGFVHWKVPMDTVQLVTQKSRLTTYLWRDPGGGHHFCPTCGTPMFRTGYSDRISVNARCLDGMVIFALEIGRYDGRNLMPPGPT